MDSFNKLKRGGNTVVICATCGEGFRCWAYHCRKFCTKKCKGLAFRSTVSNEIRAAAWRYGVSREEASRWATIKLCEICGRKKSRMVFDHDHNRPGRIRGRLCHGYNVALGLFGENIDVLIQAIDYLKSRSDKGK